MTKQPPSKPMELLLDKKNLPIEGASSKEIDVPRGKLIALVGCDGSGKSSLTTDLISAIKKDSPVKRYYLGLGSGDLGRKLDRFHWSVDGSKICCNNGQRQPVQKGKKFRAS
ncbi:MAG: hypothetical protein ABF760_03805 [Zymomonas mobilis]